MGGNIYSMLVLGSGNVGIEIADRFFQKGYKVAVHNRTISDAVSAKDVIAPDDDRVIILKKDELKDYLASGLADFSVLSIGGGEQHVDRMDDLADVIDGVIELAEIHRDANFQGNSFIATNPLDIVTYLWALYSGLHPQTIIGIGNTVDTPRIRNIVKRIIASKVAAFGISEGDIEVDYEALYSLGPHSPEATPYLRNVTINGLPLQMVLGGDEKAYEQLQNALATMARGNYEAMRGTQKEVAQALEYLVTALVQNDQRPIVGSIFLDWMNLPEFVNDLDYSHIKSKGIFTGYRAKFADRIVVPEPIELVGIEKRLFGNGCIGLENQLGALRKGKLTGIDGNPMKIDGYVEPNPRVPSLEIRVAEGPVVVREPKVEEVVEDLRPSKPKRIRDYTKLKKGFASVGNGLVYTLGVGWNGIRAVGREIGNFVSSSEKDMGWGLDRTPFDRRGGRGITFTSSDVRRGYEGRRFLKKSALWLAIAAVSASVVYGLVEKYRPWLNEWTRVHQNEAVMIPEKVVRTPEEVVMVQEEEISSYYETFLGIKELVAQKDYKGSERQRTKLARALKKEEYPKAESLLEDVIAYEAVIQEARAKPKIYEPPGGEILRGVLMIKHYLYIKDPANPDSEKKVIDGSTYVNLDEGSQILSPDKKHIVFLESYGIYGKNMYVVDADGTDLRKVLTHDTNPEIIGWVDNNTLWFKPKRKERYRQFDIDNLNGPKRERPYDPG